MNKSRRSFVKKSVIGITGLTIGGIGMSSISCSGKPSLKFGLVTYQWGKDWDLPTLISNCEKTGLQAVELRTEHAHGVETSLNQAERKEVRKRFADSPVTCVGYGSNFEYHSPDTSKLQWNIDQTKEYVMLCKDIGATGLKVKPNTLPPDVPKEKTIAQIAASLNEVGRFAKDYGQLIRVEAHGRFTSELPNMKAIFDQVTEENVKICWNSNVVDLNPPGIEGNFNMVKQWIGDTVHVRELTAGDYPYEKLFQMLTEIKFKGFILLEASSDPADRIVALKEQVAAFKELSSIVK
ncbi:MAG: TIM barrel protein [Prolixibacteraceae bacterium]|jgi:sugar phosphate isomerase/epimerase|nr:TIM barrel protein [Prolixibacteraceae bacterium]